jgi:hypothetical protein
MEEFIKTTFSSEEAFWIMWYFLKEHYDLSGGQFDISDILSASEPMEHDPQGHIDGQMLGNRKTSPADNRMILFWNEAIERFRAEGIPPTKRLKK